MLLLSSEFQPGITDIIPLTNGGLHIVARGVGHTIPVGEGAEAAGGRAGARDE
jgi:hypothetical protein